MKRKINIKNQTGGSDGRSGEVGNVLLISEQGTVNM